MSDIGVNKAGIDQKIILGKEIGKYGKEEIDRKIALGLAQVNEGSEIVYKADDGTWHVNELKEKDFTTTIIEDGWAGAAGEFVHDALKGTDDLSKDDKADISLDADKMKKAGIN